jgi:antitoxin MazE
MVILLGWPGDVTGTTVEAVRYAATYLITLGKVPGNPGTTVTPGERPEFRGVSLGRVGGARRAGHGVARAKRRSNHARRGLTEGIGGDYIVSTEAEMRTRIVRIGNSQGVRIPKPLLEQAELSGEVEMTIVGRTIVIAAAAAPRAGWSDAFRTMAEAGDDALLDAPQATAFDEDAWTW